MNYTIYKTNRKWADKIMPKVIEKIEEIFADMDHEIKDIYEADAVIDMTEATDIVVELQNGKQITIGVRVRKNEYKDKQDVTIRKSYKNSNAKSELDKLKEGYCKYIFYAYLDDTNTDIEEYIFINVDRMRKNNMLKIYHPSPCNKSDSDSMFCCYSFEELKNWYEYDCVVCHWRKPED